MAAPMRSTDFRSIVEPILNEEFNGIYDQVLPYAGPFVLGGFVLSVLGALLSYPAAYFFLVKYRHHSADPTATPLPPSDSVG